MPLVLFASIEAAKVDDLAHHLEGRLGSKLLLARHVQIIDEQAKRCVRVLWAVDAFLVLFKFAECVLLDLVCSSSRRHDHLA